MKKWDLARAKEAEIKLPTSVGLYKKQWDSRKLSVFASLIIQKPFTEWIRTNCEKFLKRWEYYTTLLAS